MIVAIDPGLRGCGVAVFEDTGELRHAAYVPTWAELPVRGAVAWRFMARAVDWHVNSHDVSGRELGAGPFTALCVEAQQHYSRGGRKTRAASRSGDLTEVTGVAATLCAVIPAVTYLQPLPAEWKRNKEKKAKCREIEEETKALGEWERVVLPRSAKLRLDVWDAVGLGRWAHLRLRVTASR